MNVEQYIDALLKREAGYVDHPADRGGPTNHGITELVARAFGYQGDMRFLPVDLARRIYLARYWIRPEFDQINLITAPVAEELLDTGVNMGPPVAAAFLQRMLNVFNLEGKTYPDIKADGDLGPMSRAALKAFLKHRGKEGEAVLLRGLNSLQGNRYVEIAENRPSQEAFVYGWFRERVS